MTDARLAAIEHELRDTRVVLRELSERMASVETSLERLCRSGNGKGGVTLGLRDAVTALGLLVVGIATGAMAVASLIVGR